MINVNNKRNVGLFSLIHHRIIRIQSAPRWLGTVPFSCVANFQVEWTHASTQTWGVLLQTWSSAYRWPATHRLLCVDIEVVLSRHCSEGFPCCFEAWYFFVANETYCTDVIVWWHADMTQWLRFWSLPVSVHAVYLLSLLLLLLLVLLLLMLYYSCLLFSFNGPFVSLYCVIPTSECFCFCYWLIRVVLNKGPLNGLVVGVICSY